MSEIAERRARIARGRYVSRSRRVRRALLTIVTVSAGLICVMVLQRDVQDQRHCHERIAFALEALEEIHAGGHAAPIVLPQPPQPVPVVFTPHFRYDPFFEQLARFKTPVAVAWCENPHQRVWLENGRHLLEYDGQHYQVRWLAEPDFLAYAKAAGILQDQPR